MQNSEFRWCGLNYPLKEYRLYYIFSYHVLRSKAKPYFDRSITVFMCHFDRSAKRVVEKSKKPLITILSVGFADRSC